MTADRTDAEKQPSLLCPRCAGGDRQQMAASGRSSVDGTSGDARRAAKRQVGSTFKPFVYAAAFSKGMAPEHWSMIRQSARETLPGHVMVATKLRRSERGLAARGARPHPITQYHDRPGRRICEQGGGARWRSRLVSKMFPIFQPFTSARLKRRSKI